MEQRLNIVFGDGMYSPSFTQINVEDNVLTAEWVVYKLPARGVVGGAVSSLQNLTPSDIVATFTMTQEDLVEMSATLSQIFDVTAVSETGLELDEWSEHPVTIKFGQDSEKAIMVVQNVIQNAMSGMAIASQSMSRINELASELDKAIHERNELAHQIEYLKLMEEKPYDQAIADLAKYRAIFPPDVFAHAELVKLSKELVKAKAEALEKVIGGEK